MKVRLLHPERDLDLADRLPWQLRGLIEDDLELRTLYQAMASGDTFLLDTVKQVFPLIVTDPDEILYRQRVLSDCIANRSAVQQLYNIATEADKTELWNKAVLARSVRILKRLVASLTELRNVSDEYRSQFSSAGFQQLFTMFTEELSDGYLAEVHEYLNELELPRGVLFSAHLGAGGKSEHYVLHQPPQLSRWARLSGRRNAGGDFVVDNEDLDGHQALIKLMGRAVNEVATTLTQSADHIHSFLQRLRTELGFYLGGLNLYDELAKRSVAVCFPIPKPAAALCFECRGLRDVGLCLTSSGDVTGNYVKADGKGLIVVTGANNGGKSTFLRSIGTAQLMMQAGLFVTAEVFSADVRDGVLTHFKREEDRALRHGKLEEELARMDRLVESLSPMSMLLCNESFASTNELEGSQIALEIVHGMVASGVKLFFVTHLYDLASSLYDGADTAHLFLRAERQPRGDRTFRMTPGRPEPTSHGEDSFQKIFGTFG